MSIEDSLIRRQIFIQRFSGGRAKEAEQMLLDILAEVQARLLQEPTEFQVGRLTRLTNDINIITSRGLENLSAKLLEDIAEFSEDELIFYNKVVEQGLSVKLSVPAIAQIEQAVMLTGMDAPLGPKTLTIREALDNFDNKKSAEILREINEGILHGETTPQIANRVGNLSDRHKAQVNALTRTIVNHSASQARRSFNNTNPAVLKGEEWVATLDSRTTLICGGRDGRLYQVGRGPYPPAHWNCRSVRVPVVSDEFAIGPQAIKRPEVGDSGAGQVSGETKFDGWLRKQDADFQDEYFAQFPDGKEKAALFRRGKLDIQQFRDETGRDYTLDELRALEPLAFKKANIKPEAVLP